MPRSERLEEPVRRPARQRAAAVAVTVFLAIGTLLAGLTPATAAPATGGISGAVTANGQAIEGAWVAIYDASSQWQEYMGGTNTDAQGKYALAGLPPGNYKVSFDSFSTDTAPQWWKNATSYSSATSIAIAAGATVSGISASLAAGGRISGNIKSAGASNTNLDGVDVHAYGADGRTEYAVTDASGNYTVSGLTAGDYTLEFVDQAGSYASQWWNAKTTRERADTFAVAAGATVTGKNATLPIAASISGNVKGSGSSASNLEGVSVTAQSEDGAYKHTNTDSSGNYVLDGLSSGTYSVQFYAYESGYITQWWEAKSSQEESTKIVLEEGQTTVASAVLEQGASISGNIKGAGSPNVNLAGVDVQVNGVDSSHWGAAQTDAMGNYVVKSLPAGTYTVHFSTASTSLNYVSSWLKDSSSATEPTRISLTSAQAIAGKNAVLEAGASVSGNVKGAGSPASNLAGVSVNAYTHSSEASVSFSTTTDKDGNYTIVGMPMGDYSLAFDAARAGLNYVSQSWGAALGELAPQFAVPRAGSVTGKDVVMARGGTISGNVKTLASPVRNLEGVWVNAYGANTPASQSTYTDSAGNYTVYGLPAGSYTVKFNHFGGFSGPAYASQWWDGAAQESAATPVTVTVAKDSPGKNASLVEGSELSGRVTDASGSGLSNIFVPVWQKDGSEWLNIGADITDDDGNYRMYGLNAGTYRMGFTDSENDEYWNQTLSGDAYSAQFFSGKSTFATADAITLGTAKAVTNPTVVLQKKPAVTKPITSTPVPSVTGLAQVGKILVASAGSWSPAPVALEYQWNRDGAAIPGATASTYTVAPADLGTKMTVTVTGSKTGYATKSTTSEATAAVIAAPVPPLPVLTATPVPTIAGETTVGKVLTATAGVWAPAPVTVTYQWNRDGVPITGATGATHTLEAADTGKKLSVSVTGKKDGYETATKTSIPTGTVSAELKTFTLTPAPVVSGTPEVGRTLTADPGSWAPTPDSLAFQWARDGVIVRGATSGTYTLTDADLGKKITVTVTAVKSGYAATAQSSLASPAIATSTLKNPKMERVSGDDRYNTAVNISKSYAPGVSVVYVATGGMFPDALAAAPAAAVQGGPLLLTTDTSLPAAVKAEIERLKPKKIVVVGGETAVSASVYKELGKLTGSIRRDSGSDRFETARTIVKNAFGTSGTATAFIATARNFPDALAASAAAGAAGAPVVLVDGEASGIDAPTKKLLTDLKVSQVSIAGGTAVVNSQMEASLKSVLGNSNVTRLSGSDRYETSGAINRASFTSSESIYLAVGTGYADALAGAALAGKNKAPLYTVQGHCVPSYVIADITSLGATQVVLLGGVNALGVGVEKLTPCS